MFTGMSRISGHEVVRTESFARVVGCSAASPGSISARLLDPAGPVPEITSLIEAIRESRRWTLALVEDLDDIQLLTGGALNPFLWEMGHVAWFYEHFVLGTLASGSSCNAGNLYNSEDVLLGQRGSLVLPGKMTTIEYMQRVEDAVCDEVSRGHVDEDFVRLCHLALRHEDMHAETLIYARQALDLPLPACLGTDSTTACSTSQAKGDVEIKGGTAIIGSDHSQAFDNERQSHPIEVRPFMISRTAVTNAEYLGFLESGGYRTGKYWDPAGEAWRKQTGAFAPLYWAQGGEGSWMVRNFGKWQPLVLISRSFM